MIDPYIDHLDLKNVNSLTMTNIMKTLNVLRIDREDLYDYIVECIQTNYHKLDNIALVYTFCRLVRLGKFEHANKVLDLYVNKLDLIKKIK